MKIIKKICILLSWLKFTSQYLPYGNCHMQGGMHKDIHNSFVYNSKIENKIVYQWGSEGTAE